jgi:tetratricopeptide (TPR) repeat protein
MSRPGFLAELRRRRVVRVALVYGVSAFAVIQVADLVFPRILLPDWTVSLVVWLAILGFPVALALSWAFDLTPDGVQRTRPASLTSRVETSHGGDAGPAAPQNAALRAQGRVRFPALSRQRTAAVGLAAAVVLAAGAVGLLDRQGTGTDAGPALSAHVLAVLPFEVRGGGEIAYLAEGMVDLLATKLSGADPLRVVDARALLEHVRRQTGSSASGAGQAAARNFGARYFVLGSVVEFSGRMQLRASLYSLQQPDRALTEASAQGGEAELFEMVDALAAQLLAGLSDGPPGRLARIAALTTHSIDALKLYLAGERAYRAARFDEAVDQFGRALRIDSTFALAAYRLATSAMWTEDNDLLHAALEIARSHQAKLATRERALLDAFHAYRTEQHGSGERQYRQIISQYPDEIDGWYMLGELVLHEGSLLGYTLADALEPFARALALSPSHSAALYHRMNLAALLGDTAGVLEYSGRLLQESADSVFALIDRAYLMGDHALQHAIEARLPSMAEPVNTYYASIASMHALESQPEVPRRVWGIIGRSSPTAAVRALGHVQLARFEAARGQLTATAAELRAAGRLDRHLGWQERVRYALHPLHEPPVSALRSLRDSLRLWTPPPTEPMPGHLAEFRFGHAAAAVHTYLVGALDVRIDPGAARRAARELAGHTGDTAEAQAARDLGALLEAELERLAGDPAAALRRLEEAGFWSARTIALRAGTLTFAWPVFLRAELLREAGRMTEAAHWYHVAGDHLVEYRAPALYRLCQIQETAGDVAGARDACRRFVALWHDADAALQSVVEDARQRLARVEAGR